MHKSIPVIITILLAVTGCAGKIVLMKNAETGDVERCEVSTSSAMQTGMWSANRDIARCVAALEKAGYTKVN